MAETLPVKKTPSLFDELARMHHSIAQRAFELFEANGGISGRELDDWLQAERELVWTPSIELKESHGQFFLRVAVPGVDPKNITIEATPEDVLLTAEFSEEKEEKTGDIHTSEFKSGRLFRSIHMPKRIDVENVRAEFEHGMLTIKAAIASDEKPRTISIGAA